MSSTDAYNAPCEVGADVHGREILVLKHLRSTWEISERKAAKEMLDMGIITVQDYNHSIREAHLEAVSSNFLIVFCVRCLLRRKCIDSACGRALSSQERRAKAAEAKQMDPYKGKNRVIMMEWEKPYMEACVDHMAINSSSVVLEIGFGLGYSATRIQSYRPKRHVIIGTSFSCCKCRRLVRLFAAAAAAAAAVVVVVVTMRCSQKRGPAFVAR